MVKSINEIRYDKSGVILFNSYSKTETEVLSNLHLCRLTYDGQVFNSSEQLFFWLRLTGYPEYQEKLMQCDTPKEVKRIGERFMKKLGISNDIVRQLGSNIIAVKSLGVFSKGIPIIFMWNMLGGEIQPTDVLMRSVV